LTVDGNCERAKSCPSGTTEVAGFCTADVNLSCPSGTTEIAGICTADVTIGCPSGFSPEGLVCTKDPSTSNHSHCDVPDPFGGPCIVSSNHVHVSCSSGTLNIFGKCETGTTRTCPSGTTDNGINCTSTASRSCPTGTTDNGINCTSTASRSCPTGTTDNGINCTSDGSCPSGYTKGAFVCYNPPSCPGGTTLTVNICTADVKFDCSYLEMKDGKATFEEILLVCFKEDGACPTGSIWEGGFTQSCLAPAKSSTCPPGYDRYLLGAPTTNREPYQCVKEASKDGITLPFDPTLPDDGLKVPELSIPKWVKNTAGWWSERSVDDSDFTGGISYLIEEDIISIPDLPVVTEAAEENVPDWVRNMAGWWADNLTSDQEFADAIKYP